MKIGFAAAIALAALLVGASSGAHHNPAALYDVTQEVTVRGTVTRFNPGNPHVRIFFTRLDGVGDEGAEWMAEGGSRTVLLRRDWTVDTVKPGDVITLTGHPAREQRNIMHFERIVLPDGRSLWGEDVPAPETIGEMAERQGLSSAPSDDAVESSTDASTR
jgi:hypothetical protein